MPFHLPEPTANSEGRLSVSRKNHKASSPFILAKNGASSSGVGVLLQVPNGATVPAKSNPNRFAGREMGNWLFFFQIAQPDPAA